MMRRLSVALAVVAGALGLAPAVVSAHDPPYRVVYGAGGAPMTCIPAKLWAMNYFGALGPEGYPTAVFCVGPGPNNTVYWVKTAHLILGPYGGAHICQVDYDTDFVRRVETDCNPA